MESNVDQHSKETASFFIEKLFSLLDQWVDTFNKDENIHWVRYGDGYVFYSTSDEMYCLRKVVKDSARLLAFALNQTIPIRIAITQGNIKINKSKTAGLSITGSGWNSLLVLEKSLDWMGGVLSLPSYDGHHHQEITNLIQSTNLIIQHKILTGKNKSFTAPFKKNFNFAKDRVWFINWYKILCQSDEILTQSINRWWHDFQVGNKSISEEVKKKQNNTIQFARYCITLHESSQLVYFAQVSNNIKIGEITNHE